ncbi:hypothetical protein [Labedaea rhizosphaerae]|uniref:Aromatic ring-opening dioxygenase catalytic subunit (LigB family) n=1 Tax=Labedaea rhizosphaerae TaxID=598644 RepID=A0A4R6S7L3_LABRH|nr:hypothetical protein [Labedaea rhizosphaerae]TDP94795.1 aromatic ring-opening dioxygenase catalytic subunit (LigB family) [Labedaea rhizosphaerae]
MAEIVAAAAAVHAPQLLSRPKHEELDKLDRSTDALVAFGAELEKARPDAVLVIGLDHLETFWLEAVPTFTLVVSQECEAHYMEQQMRKQVHTEVAIDLLKKVIADGFDITYSQEAVLGHAFLTPFKYILGKTDAPVIPLLVNTYLPPIPSPRRCYELGKAIGRALQTRDERIAVIASGGMSHFPGTSRYMAPNYEFDRWIIQEAAAGRYEDLLDLTPVNLDEVGESELLTWCVLLGIIGQVPGHLLSYQEMAHHGQGVIQFLPQVGGDNVHEASKETSLPRHGGYEFTSNDYVYYKFPEPETLPLNKFLHRLIVEEDLRNDYARDAEKVIAGSGLAEHFQNALRQPGFDALVEAGAHPLLALSSRQVVRLAADRLAEAAS